MVPLGLPTATAGSTFARLHCAQNQLARCPGALNAIRPTQVRHYFEIVHPPPALAASISF